jgi:hypothetical protein
VAGPLGPEGEPVYRLASTRRARRWVMFRVVLIVVPLGLLATVTLRPTIVTHLPSVVVDLLLALIIVWPILVFRSLRR